MLLAAVLQCPGGEEGGGQDSGEAAVGGLHGAHGLDVSGEAAPGVGIGVRGGVARRAILSPA